MANKKKTEKVSATVCEEAQCCKTECCKKPCCGRWVSVGWVLLLLGGLAHMLPVQMEPVLKWSLWGISFQMAVGVLSVIVALNFLLEEE